jgi:predicted PurR-regulated permease PerM
MLIKMSIFLIAITGLVFTIWLIFTLGTLLTPFIVSLVLAFLLDPLVDKGEKLKLPRSLSIIIIFLLTSTVIGIIMYWFIPALINESKQIIELTRDLPQTGYDAFIEHISPYLSPEIKGNITDFINEKLVNNSLDILKNIVLTISNTIKGISVVISSIISIVMIPVLTFYILRDYDKLGGFIKRRIPDEYVDDTMNLYDEIKNALSGYIRGQLIMILIEGGILGLGLTLLGVKFGLLIGLFAGVLNLIPFAGMIIGIIPALVSAAFNPDPIRTVILTAILFIVVQTIDAYIISPKIVGDRVGLHPVIIILILLAGAHFFGVVGFFIAIPVASVVKILLKYIFKKS